MTIQFGGGLSGNSFVTAPSTGSPTIAIGTGPFVGGSTPNFQGTAALGVNMAAGYSGMLADFQMAGVSKFSVDQSGSVIAGQLAPVNGYTALVLSSTILAVNTQPTNVLFQVKGATNQTADVFEMVDHGGTNQFGIANIGTGGAPIWCLRVAPIANAASMAQAHTIGAATGKAIQVIDNSGTSLGWIALYA